MQRSRARTSDRISCSQSLHAVREHRRRASPWKPFPRTPLHMVASLTPIYRCCIGTAIEVDARARARTHLKPGRFPLAPLDLASLLQISGFSQNIASAPPCLPCSIPEFPSSLLILPYGAALSSSARRGEHCLPVRRCRKHRAADDDNAAGNLERSWNGSHESSKHHSPGRIGNVQRHCLRRADGIDAFVIEEVGSGACKGRYDQAGRGGPRLLPRAPPPLGEGHQRERQRAPARPLPEGREPGRRTDAEVNAAYAMLNRRPRKRLGWKCPQEVFCSQALRLL